MKLITELLANIFDSHLFPDANCYEITVMECNEIREVSLLCTHSYKKVHAIVYDINGIFQWNFGWKIKKFYLQQQRKYILNPVKRKSNEIELKYFNFSISLTSNWKFQVNFFSVWIKFPIYSCILSIATAIWHRFQRVGGKKPFSCDFNVTLLTWN